ncbi:multidrug resistance-associated protein 1-like [Limulus polyphemus]|uniref:Multidrug resistance-associated protein 1-like n=1 Tax=Limulus polyphemus TaxID=6850 RepID=A0ABM1BG96_LIMPO|nr:multidrug resistance-associated protein 1-like [Limulus polyphemus]
MVILLCLCVAEVGLSIRAYSLGWEVFPADYYSPFIKCLTLIMALVFVLVGRRRGMGSSGILFLFWFLFSLCNLITYRSVLMDTFSQDTHYSVRADQSKYVIKVVNFPVLLVVLFLSCFVDKRPLSSTQGKKIVNPEENASFLSRITFWWFTSMAIKGYRKPLVMEDMWELSTENKTSGMLPEFDKHWIPVLKKAIQRSQMDGSSKDKGTKNVPVQSQVNILWPLLKTFPLELFVAGFMKLVGSLMPFVNPQILSLVIAFVSGDEPYWRGFLYATLMFFASMIESLFNSQYEYRIFCIAMRIRSCVVSALYRKSLQLSNSARKNFTVGEIVNLMAVDTQRVMEFIQIVNLLWSAPLQIGVCLWMLWQQLGVSTLGGLAVMILLFPVNGVITAKLRNLQIRMMKEKDKRIKLMNEILSGIKVLKLYAWEESFQEQVTKIRDKEIRVLTIQAYLAAAITFAFTCAPFLVALASFAMYVLLDPRNVLDASTAFVSLSLFNILRAPMAFLPMLVTFAAMFVVSLSRINKFLGSDELDPDAVSNDDNEKDVLVMENAVFAWSRDEAPTLKDISFRIKPGSLVALVGQVGAGKSSILSAFLGDMEKLEGYVNIKGSIAYVPQQAWIQNETIRNNVLFGKKYTESKYNRILEATALKPDLEVLPGGDQTEVGEKGINVSGGQKQRISLARAVYNDADVYLLDDPLSAVDSHVGKHIFDNVLGSKGLLKEKTRLLVTHKISILPQVDTILVLKDGYLTESGSYSELLNKKGAFSDILVHYISEEVGKADDIDPEELQIIEQVAASVGPNPKLERCLSRLSSSESDIQRSGSERSLSIHSSQDGLRKRRSKSGNLQMDEKKEKKPVPPPRSRLIDAEYAEVGSVKWWVYFAYIKAIGLWGIGITLVAYAVSHAFSLGANIWLSEWSNDASDPEKVTDIKLRNLRLGVYGALGTGETIFVLLATVMLNLATLWGSQILHDRMLEHVMKCRMSFFDTTPMGRILNRFSKDVDTTDITIRFNVRLFLIQCFRATIAFIGICLETPIFLAVVLPLGVCYYFIQRFYISSSRQLKRIESITRSPIYTHFSETVTGTTSIRAYGATKRFISESNSRVDFNHSSYFPSLAASRWLAIRLEFLGYCIVFFSALFAVLTKGTISPGIAGLSISYALTVTVNLNMLVRASSDVETNIVSVERCLEYTTAPTEAAWYCESNKPDKSWPRSGNVVFDNYTTRYREGLDLVLYGLSCNVHAGEKVGIVGRTGAGKSSLTLSLFRIIEAAGGSITIDGVDISKIGLHDLRSKLTIIPQDPVLFTGTLRMNLDPFGHYDDEAIWNSLELAHLKGFVSGLDAGLDHQVSEGGDNLSVGQRQLVCLARALLRKSKILVLDEATAAIDLETDDLIQATIRKEFRDSTVLTIAHRLNTVLDYDRIMVLDKGKIIEYDSPSDLLEDEQSVFYSMAKDAGLI